MAGTRREVIRQNSKIADVTYIVPLTEGEARQLTNSIKAHLQAADAQILELHERDGWKALGYTSWRDCIQAEFNLTQSRGYQLLALARVKRNIIPLPSGDSTIVEKRPVINEAQARVLSKIPAGRQREVYEEAVTKAPNGKPTARQIAQVLTKPVPKPLPSKKPVQRDDTRSRCKALIERMSERRVQQLYETLCDELGVLP